jgi:RNA polymerase sigma factor (sigma-70 family)
MAAPAQRLLRHLRRLAAAPASDPATDAVLLERFRRGRDEAAFAALVRRHGPLVWRLCRRLLGDDQAAEDAYQATFLVLVRKAKGLRLRTALAGWLYGVARRVAFKARARAARRRRHETPAASLFATDHRSDPLAQVSAREVLTALEDEVARLREVYRLPVVLCGLEGLSQEEAARRLGWTPGSVKGRLERGRKLLHARLARRGMMLSAALAVVEVTRGAAGVPATLEATTIQAALAGGAGEIGEASGRVLALAHGAMHGTFSGRVRATLALLLILGAGVLGASLLPQTPPASERPGQTRKAVENPGQKSGSSPVRPGTDLHGDPLPAGAIARLGTERLRHHHSTADLATAFSPDGKTVVTGGDGTLKRWDVATGKLLRRYPERYSGTVLFSPNGKWFVAAGGDLLDAASGEVVRRFSLKGHRLTFSPDGKLLATGAADGSVTLWDTASGEVTRRLRGHEKDVVSGVFSTNGRTLVTICMDMKVCRWDVATGELRRTVALPITRWRTWRLSPDGGTLAVSQAAGVSLWDTTTGKERGHLGEEAAKARYGLAFSDDGKLLATDWYDAATRESRICLWDVAGRKLLRQFPIPARAMGFLFLSPDNRTLASSGTEPRLRLWDTTTGRPLHQHAAHDGGIAALAFTPDGRTLVSGSNDGTLRAWDAAAGRSVRELPGHAGGVSGLAATPDGRAVLSGGYDAQILLQDRQTGKELRRLVLVPKEKLSPHGSYGPHVGLSADGRTAVAHIGTDDGGSLLHVWDPATGKVLARREDRSRTFSVLFSPDARTLATYVDTLKPAVPPKDPKAKALKEGAVEVTGTQVVLQDVATGRPRLAIPLPDRNGYRAAFAPDGRSLLTYGYRVRTDAKGSHWDNHALHLWELASGQERLTIRSPVENDQGGYECVTFSPDGRTLAAARQDRTIQEWDVATGAEMLTRGGYEAAVDCLAFRPDGKALASGHRDSTILLWDLTAGLRRPRPGNAPTPRQLEQAWADLASTDGHKAHAAIWKLVAAPAHAVPLLGARLRPAAAPPADEIRKLLADLDSAQYERREAASRRLADHGEAAEATLEEALKADPSAEKRRRIEQLLAAPRVVRIPEQLRALRSVEALERIGNAEARRVLEGIAKGAPEARLTREARASLERLPGRTAAAP